MPRGRRRSQKRAMNPVYHVFCEGKTERAYTHLLRSKYRVNIEVKTYISGQEISSRYIKSYLKHEAFGPKDRVFLVFDLDAPKMLERVQKIENVTLLLSNPCFELWLLLHCEHCTGNISSSNCVNKLKKHWPQYKKGGFSEQFRSVLLNEHRVAISNAKSLNEFSNPSTSVYKLLEELETLSESN